MATDAPSEAFIAPEDGLLPLGYADTRAKAGSSPRAHLVDAGEQPRQERRYRFAPGERFFFAMTEESSFALPPETEAPPKLRQISRFEGRVREVTSEGTARIELTYLGVEVYPDPDQTFAHVAGSKISFAVTATGNTSDVQFHFSAQVPKEEQILLAKGAPDRWLVPLPEAPLGAGARWTFDRRVDAQNIDALAHSTATLLREINGVLTVREERAVYAAARTTQSDELPGVHAEITRFRGEGSAETTFDLAHLSAYRSDARAQNNATFTVSSGDKQLASSSVFRSETRFETAPR